MAARGHQSGSRIARFRQGPARWGTRVLCAAVLLGQMGCAGQEPQTVLDIHLGQSAGLTGRLWPVPPEVPRYRYVGELLGEQNIRPVDGSAPASGAAFWRWLTGVGQTTGRPVVLQRPQSGATDAAGRTYVTDVSRQAVFVFDAVQGTMRLWEFADGRRRFIAPVGITLDHQGRVLVTDAELGAVFRFDPDGSFLGSFGEGILKRPTGIAFDPLRQRVYVADTEADNVKVFDGSGRLLDTLGYAGDGTGRLNRPVYLAFAGGHLYVSDSLNARVQVFDREGNPTAIIGRRGMYVGNLTRPKGVAVDGEGNVYIVEGLFDHLLIYGQDGQLLLGIGGTGKRPGQFYLPTGVWTDSANRIYVADMFNGRVSIFQFLGAEQ